MPTDVTGDGTMPTKELVRATDLDQTHAGGASRLETRNQMPAGPQLDDLVAVRVMGWHKNRLGGSLYVWSDSENRRVADFHNSDCCDCLTDFPRFSPSSLIDDAFRVAQKLKHLTGGAILVIDRENSAMVAWPPFTNTTRSIDLMMIGCHDKRSVEAPTVEHAICLAGLSIVGAA